MHIGIGAALIVIAVLYFMIHSPGFRTTVITVAVGLVILVAFITIANQHPRRHSAAPRPAVPVGIAP
jgi:hypothetical protein